MSLRSIWIMYVAFAALGVGISAFVRNRKLIEDHTVTKTGLKEEEVERREAEMERKSMEK